MAFASAARVACLAFSSAARTASAASRRAASAPCLLCNDGGAQQRDGERGCEARRRGSMEAGRTLHAPPPRARSRQQRRRRRLARRSSAHAPGARRACTRSAACMHQERGVLAPGARRACIRSAACMHQERGVEAYPPDAERVPPPRALFLRPRVGNAPSPHAEPLRLLPCAT